jgi:hypothetical protein
MTAGRDGRFTPDSVAKLEKLSATKIDARAGVKGKRC